MNDFDDNFEPPKPLIGGGSHKLKWDQASFNLNSQGKGFVLITIIGVSGSTPRNSGTKMVVSQNQSFDTIGGGHLEYKAIQKAQELLQQNQDCQVIEHFQLGSQLGQCCGGNASLLFEYFAASKVHIAVFGAGHVAQALVPILASLPCHITWVDNREVASMPSNTLNVVMTHNHQLDFEISLAILKREDFHYLGLIASDTKWRRFQQRYKHRDVKPSLVERMNCPIGLEQVVGKMPMEVAVSVAGEIIESYQSLLSVSDNVASTEQASKKSKGVAWQEVKQLLAMQTSKSSDEVLEDES